MGSVSEWKEIAFQVKKVIEELGTKKMIMQTRNGTILENRNTRVEE
jgi:hypothetical protein